MLIYREIFISNIYIGIYGCNRQSTRTISFFGSLHMYKKSVFLIKSPQGPDIQHREVYEPCLIKSMAKKIFKYKYAVCICHRWINLLFTEDKHKTANRLDFNIAVA